MWKPSLSSLRSRAVVLVLLAILPLLALTLYSYLGERGRAIHEMHQAELVAVRSLATIQETVINDSRLLLETLAQLPLVQRRDREACNVLFANLLKQGPYFASIVATDPAGELFASAPAVPGPINYADRLWFQKVKQTRGFVVGELVLGRTSQKYGIILAYPIVDGEGRYQGALPLQVDIDWLGAMVARSKLPPTTALVLSDSSHKVLFRYPEPQQYIGKMLPDALVRVMAGSDEGVAAGVGLPGDRRLFAFTRLSPPWQEMSVSMGVPMDWAVGPVNRVLVRNLIFLGLVTLFAVASAWYGGGLFIVQPVKRLRTVTERLAAGDLSVRTGPDYPAGELGLLAHSFDQMADSLEEHEAESQRLLNLVQQEKEKLTSLINSINDEVWFADTQKKFTIANPSALREFGLDSFEDTDVEKLAESLEVYRADGSPRPAGEAPPLRALQGELVKNLEEIIRTPATGELRYRQVGAGPVRDVNGNIIGSVSVVRDVTDLKRAEEALRRANEELEQRVQERTADLEKANNLLKKSEEHLRYLASKILTAQEQERKRLAIELHDGLGQSLSALKMFLRAIQRHLPKEAEIVKEDFEDAQKLLRETIDETRKISRGLSPTLLKNLGLSAAVRYLLEEFSKYNNATITFDADDIQNLFSHQTEINLFRVCQEALNNIAKHSRATQVSVAIKRQDGNVDFCIKDNGVGFDLNQFSQEDLFEKGMGIAAMDERLRMIGTHLTIVSQQEMGTEISFSIPIDAN